MRGAPGGEFPVGTKVAAMMGGIGREFGGGCAEYVSSGEASDLTQHELQGFLDAVAAGHVRVPIGRTFTLDEIAQAHTLMESGTAGGKIVVNPRRSPWGGEVSSAAER